MLREGTKKTVFVNLMEICNAMHRSHEHVTQYLMAELGTSGTLDGQNRLIIKGRFLPKVFEGVLRHYFIDYVICQMCKSSDTKLVKDPKTRLNSCVCQVCGSSRSVSAIQKGFQAVARATAEKLPQRHVSARGGEGRGSPRSISRHTHERNNDAKRRRETSRVFLEGELGGERAPPYLAVSTLAPESGVYELRLVSTFVHLLRVSFCLSSRCAFSRRFAPGGDARLVYEVFPAEAAVAAADPATTIAMPGVSTTGGTSPNITPHDVAHTTAV